MSWRSVSIARRHKGNGIRLGQRANGGWGGGGEGWRESRIRDVFRWGHTTWLPSTTHHKSCHKAGYVASRDTCREEYLTDSSSLDGSSVCWNRSQPIVTWIQMGGECKKWLRCSIVWCLGEWYLDYPRPGKLPTTALQPTPPLHLLFSSSLSWSPPGSLSLHTHTPCSSYSTFSTLLWTSLRSYDSLASAFLSSLLLIEYLLKDKFVYLLILFHLLESDHLDSHLLSSHPPLIVSSKHRPIRPTPNLLLQYVLFDSLLHSFIYYLINQSINQLIDWLREREMT